MKEFDRDQSEFNMAVSWLNRLNLLFYLSNDASTRLDAHNWFNTLMAVFRELSTEMLSKEIEEKMKEVIKINQEVAEVNRQEQRTGVAGIPQELYFKLNNFEMFLKSVMKKSGLLYKMKEDPSQVLR